MHKINAKAQALGKAIGKKVTGKVSDILSAPQRTIYGIKKAGADAGVKAIKNARAYDDAPNFDRGAPTDAFKARAVAEAVKGKFKLPMTKIKK